MLKNTISVEKGNIGIKIYTVAMQTCIHIKQGTHEGLATMHRKKIDSEALS